MNNSRLVRGALLVALALALQSLRLVLPMPQLLSTFIIGTLVHMMLVLTLQLSGLKTALLLAFLLPLTAYVQGQVLLPFLIPVIWLGNFIFVLLVRQFKGRHKLALCVPPVAKAIVMLLAAWAALSFGAAESCAAQDGYVCDERTAAADGCCRYFAGRAGQKAPASV